MDNNLLNENTINPGQEAVIEVSSVEKPIPDSLKILLISEWLLVYIPFALLLFGFSTIAGDSPYTSWWVTGVFLLLMVGSTVFSLKRKSFFLAFLPIIAAFTFPPILFIFMGF